MNLGLSKKLLAAFPNGDVIEVTRPLVKNKKIQDPNWVAGFTSDPPTPIGVGGSDWCEVAEMIKDKKHLTDEGLDKIKKN